MTNAELLDKIKAEIDKRYAEYREKMKSDDFTYYEGMADALDLFEQFIDSLESEKPMNLEKMEREEELKKAVHQVSEEIVKEIFPDDLENGDFFTEIDLKNCITRVAYQFADWQKEQMMKEAVEGTVYGNGDYTWVAGDIPSQFKYGDKVRIIIVKEDEK